LTAEQFFIASMAFEIEFLSLQVDFYMLWYSKGGSLISLRGKNKWTYSFLHHLPPWVVIWLIFVVLIDV
jgi:hypothetical protein